MRWLAKVERKLGHFAIKNLMIYIVFLNAIVFLLDKFDQSGQFITKLILIPEFVLKGEIWRLVTFAFIPPTSSLIWIIIALQFYYMVGTSLEHEWGTFKFNLFYFIGMLGTIIGSFVTGAPGTVDFLNLTLVLAFARIYPEYEILLYFVFPVKMKYLAIFNWLLIGYMAITGGYYGIIFASISIINYFIFFGKDIFTGVKSTRAAYQNRKRFYENLPREFTLHKCTTCGITEKDNPKMDFRFCTDCEGDYEYCIDHLENHPHIKQEQSKQSESE